MSVALFVSIMLHASLIGYALVSVTGTPPREPKTPSVEPIFADVISASELNRMRKGVREAKLDAAMQKDVPKPDEAVKETPKPRPTPPPPPAAAAEPPPPPPEPAKAEPPPPPPTPAKAEPPPPAPKPEPDKAALDQKLEELALLKAEEDKLKVEAEAKAKAEADAKAKAAEQKRLADEKRKADEKRRAEEKRKADEKRKRDLAEAKRKADAKKAAEAKKALDTGRLAALLDKTPDPKQAAAANDAPLQPTTAKGPVRGDAQGRDQTISANEASFLAGLMRQAVSRCWNINAGLDGIQQMVVKVEIKLSQSGDLVGEPRVVNTNPSPVFQDAAASAKRALVQCAPYTLPPDKYAGGWEHMILTFDPARMF